LQDLLFLGLQLRRRRLFLAFPGLGVFRRSDRRLGPLLGGSGDRLLGPLRRGALEGALGVELLQRPALAVDDAGSLGHLEVEFDAPVLLGALPPNGFLSLSVLNFLP